MCVWVVHTERVSECVCVCECVCGAYGESE